MSATENDKKTKSKKRKPKYGIVAYHLRGQINLLRIFDN